jgi:hypothetical protein
MLSIRSGGDHQLAALPRNNEIVLRLRDEKGLAGVRLGR